MSVISSSECVSVSSSSECVSVISSSECVSVISSSECVSVISSSECVSVISSSECVSVISSSECVSVISSSECVSIISSGECVSRVLWLWLWIPAGLSCVTWLLSVRDEYHTQSYEWMQQSPDLSNYAPCLEPYYCYWEETQIPRYPRVILWWSLDLYYNWLPYSCTTIFDIFFVDTSKNIMMQPMVLC